jgi:NAD(P)-dependent dehydrogenase (short-subunit alcohol dehydrogenase family)
MAQKGLIPQTNEEPSLPGSEARLDPRPMFRPRYPGSARLEGKVAIITGGDSGIGRAVAVLFAREGCDVAIAYLEEDEDAKETAHAVSQEGRKALLVRGDLGDPAHAKALVEETVDRFGKLDILVNNAGEQHLDKKIIDITQHQLLRTFQTNFFSMFCITQAALPHLQAGSAIINTTSVTMYEGAGGLLDYSSTKGAITAFTRSLSENLVGQGIRVNAVAPGPIWTPLNPAGGKPPEQIPSFG